MPIVAELLKVRRTVVSFLEAKSKLDYLTSEELVMYSAIFLPVIEMT